MFLHALGKNSRNNRLPVLVLTLWLGCTNLSAQPMQGNYTLGGANPDFLTFGAAVQRLDSLGVSGPVTIWVRNGTYSETLFIDSIQGASATNWITFRSESGDSTLVELNGPTNSVNTKSVWLSYVSFVRFHQLTIRQLPSVHNTAVVFVGRGTNISLSNCVLWGHASSTSSATKYVVQGACDSNLLIENCVIRGAREGIVSAGSNPVAKYPIIRNNQIFGVQTNSIYLIGGVFSEISYNTIGGGGGSSSTGILVSGHSRGKIIGNRIRMISGLQGSTGIQIISSSGWANQYMLIANNEISFDAYNAPTAYGIRSSGDYHLYAHNSIRMSGGVYSAGIQLQITSQARMFNNVVVHEGTGTTNYPIDISINSSTLQSNHNNLFGAGPFLGPNMPNLAAYQTATGRDAQSVSVPVPFLNADTLYTTAPALVNSGVYLVDVPTDINRQWRSNPPDLGAYELPNIPVVYLGVDTTACDSLVLTAPAQSGVQWLWSTGDTMPSLVVRQSGSYWLQGTNALGTQRDTVEVSIVARPQLQLSASTDTLCPGGCSQLSASISGGSGAFAFQWQPASGLSHPFASLTQACPTATTTYRLLLSDSSGCASVVDSIQLVVVVAGQTSISSPIVGCEGDTILLAATTQWTGGSFVWEPAAWVESPNQAQTRAWPPVGTHPFSVRAIHPRGCEDTAYTTVQMNPRPTQPQISQQGNLLLSSSAIGNQWYLNDTLLLGAVADTLRPGVNGTYKVAVTNSFGCSSHSPPIQVLNVGVRDLPDSFTPRLWPNPAGEVLNVSLPEGILAEWLRVTDVFGRPTPLGLMNKTDEGYSLSLASWAPGIYYLSIAHPEGHRLYRKWVKK